MQVKNGIACRERSAVLAFTVKVTKEKIEKKNIPKKENLGFK